MPSPQIETITSVLVALAARVEPEIADILDDARERIAQRQGRTRADCEASILYAVRMGAARIGEIAGECELSATYTGRLLQSMAARKLLRCERTRQGRSRPFCQYFLPKPRQGKKSPID